MSRRAVKREFQIANRLGIHARPATLIVKTASHFECDIFIEKDGNKVSAKSILGLMTLEAGRGTVLVVTADGDDALQALEAIQKLIESKFDEE